MLCCFAGFGLRLSWGCHEHNQRIPRSLLHRVRGGAIEGHPVYDLLITTPRIMNTRMVSQTSVVAAKPIDPAHHERVSGPEHIEQRPSGRSASLVLTPDTPSSATTVSILNPARVACASWCSMVCSAALTRAYRTIMVDSQKDVAGAEGERTYCEHYGEQGQQPGPNETKRPSDGR
jgi:hypothetical protein